MLSVLVYKVILSGGFVAPLEIESKVSGVSALDGRSISGTSSSSYFKMILPDLKHLLEQKPIFFFQIQLSFYLNISL